MFIITMITQTTSDNYHQTTSDQHFWSHRTHLIITTCDKPTLRQAASASLRNCSESTRSEQLSFWRDLILSWNNVSFCVIDENSFCPKKVDLDHAIWKIKCKIFNWFAIFVIEETRCCQSCKNVPTVPTSQCYFFWPVLIFGKSTRKTVLLCPWLISLMP